MWKQVTKTELWAWTLFYVFTLWMYRPEGTHYLDAAHMIPHEAGHLLFSYGGRFVLTVAGGSILQLFVPGALTAMFAQRKHTTATAFCAFMFFNSMIGMGNYMADARARVLPLIAVGVASEDVQGHDWDILFEQMNLLRHDVQIGAATRFIGYVGMIAAVGWLWWMKKHLEDQDG